MGISAIYFAVATFYFYYPSDFVQQLFWREEVFTLIGHVRCPAKLAVDTGIVTGFEWDGVNA
jgi:hypothetical protein